jgi:hypothetical protein
MQGLIGSGFRIAATGLSALGLIVAASTASQALVVRYTADLSGSNESPPNSSPGTGQAAVTIDDGALTMQIEAIFNGLQGNSTVAHIHAATAVPGTGNAGVATTTPTFAGFPAGVRNGSYSNSLNLLDPASYNPAFITANGGSTTSASAALISAIAAGRAYFNLHSTSFPGGELRGFLTPASSPASVPGPLPALGAAAAFGYSRKLRKRIHNGRPCVRRTTG